MGESNKKKGKNDGDKCIDTKKTRAIDKKLKIRKKGIFRLFMLGVLLNSKIRKIWKSSGIADHPYEAMAKVNIPLIEEGDINLRNKITPDGSFIEVESAKYSRGVFRLTLSFGKDCQIKLPITLFVYIAFKRKRVIVPGSYFINLPSEKYDLLFDIREKYVRKFFLRESNPIVYVAGVGLDANRKIAWTSTSAIQMNTVLRKKIKN